MRSIRPSWSASAMSVTASTSVEKNTTGTRPSSSRCADSPSTRSARACTLPSLKYGRIEPE